MRFSQYGFSEGASEKVEQILDFTRCERPDGTAYGTGGKCRQGTERSKATIEKDIKATIQQMKGAKGLEAHKLKQKLAELKAERREPGKAKVAADPDKEAKKAWLTGKVKEMQEMAARAGRDGWNDRAAMYNKEASRLLQEKADLDRGK